MNETSYQIRFISKHTCPAFLSPFLSPGVRMGPCSETKGGGLSSQDCPSTAICPSKGFLMHFTEGLPPLQVNPHIKMKFKPRKTNAKACDASQVIGLCACVICHGLPHSSACVLVSFIFQRAYLFRDRRALGAPCVHVRLDPDTSCRGPAQGSLQQVRAKRTKPVMTCWSESFSFLPRATMVMAPFPERVTSVFFMYLYLKMQLRSKPCRGFHSLLSSAFPRVFLKKKKKKKLIYKLGPCIA